MHLNVTFLPVGRCVKTIKSTEQSHNNMKNIKSPMATPTYRRRRGKREFWSNTKALANRDLLNPSAVKPASKATKHLATEKKKSTSARDWISQMGEDIQYSVGYKEEAVRYV